MSQVLEKPILLDETGQEIVEKLDDIKDAISMGTDFVPVMIKVTTPPAKVAYMAGESLDLAGIVVDLIASNGVHIDVTDQCTFVPANGTPLTASDTSVAISYYWYRDDVTFTTSYPIGVKSLSSIAITTPPTTTNYYTGDQLDLTGIVVTATYDDGTFLDVTQNCTFIPADGATLAANDTSITASYTEGITKTATQAITVKSVYGVEWDGTASTAWTRTESASNFVEPNPYYAGMTDTPSSPFDNILPWSGMEKSTDTDDNVLVSIPKFYYKLSKNGSKLKVQIANEALDGFSVSPAHMDRGDGIGERNTVYVGRYQTNTEYKSKTNNTVQSSKSRAEFCANIRSNNTYATTTLWDITMLFTIWLLYIVEFADWNSQVKIGYGCDSPNSRQTGATDGMPYHTGTTGATRSTYHKMQYRYIENLWCNYYTFFSGMLSRKVTGGSELYIILDPTKIDNSYRSDGVKVGEYSGNGYPSEFDVVNPDGLYPLFVPTAFNGTNATYMCDYQNVNISSGETNAFYTGGKYGDNSQDSGLFLIVNTTKSAVDANIGSRLMKLPNS